MRREHHGPVAIRNLVQLVDEDRALGFQVIHHELVVHDLVAHIDGCAIKRERPLHDVDGARTTPGAEAAGSSREQDFENAAAMQQTGADHYVPMKTEFALHC
jgi:hypothetical protein